MENDVLLTQFAHLTEFLGRILGPDYEIALHDLRDPDHSLIAIANGHISGRSIGSPLTETARKFIEEDSMNASDFRLNYAGFTAAGKHLRSSTLLIRNAGRAVGMLCVNFDDSKYQAVSESILRLCHPDAFVDSSFQFDELRILSKIAEDEAERFSPTAPADLRAAIARRLKDMGETAQSLSPARRRALIRALAQEGCFLVKGAVKEAGAMLGVSQATVYRMLAGAKKEAAPPRG